MKKIKDEENEKMVGVSPLFASLLFPLTAAGSGYPLQVLARIIPTSIELILCLAVGFPLLSLTRSPSFNQ
ncbi:MAG: hypothetical protein K0R51_2324 [Cytophagaceae bacterium]|jgi:hypothetical protein|nr:hypothetical protein [Cytophagaceae bacterium]